MTVAPRPSSRGAQTQEKPCESTLSRHAGQQCLRRYPPYACPNAERRGAGSVRRRRIWERADARMPNSATGLESRPTEGQAQKRSKDSDDYSKGKSSRGMRVQSSVRARAEHRFKRRLLKSRLPVRGFGPPCAPNHVCSIRADRMMHAAHIAGAGGKGGLLPRSPSCPARVFRGWFRLPRPVPMPPQGVTIHRARRRRTRPVFQ